jgi:hypothetical protein
VLPTFWQMQRGEREVTVLGRDRQDRRMRARPRSGLRIAYAASVLLAGMSLCPAAAGERLHLAANPKGDFAGPAAVGFNLADITDPRALNALPRGMRGVYWLGNGYNTECRWRLSDQAVANTVAAIRNHPRFSGIYYISNEPRPGTCPEAPARVAERSKLIRSLDPRARTFIVVSNGSGTPDEFAKLKDAADYIGLNPYPCNVNNAVTRCNLRMLADRIDRALAVGIAAKRLVPVFQVFGQDCSSRRPVYYRLPDVGEVEAMLALWDKKLPPEGRPFDIVYSWGEQEGVSCPTLKTADGAGAYPDLKSVFARYFAGKGASR